MSSVQYTFLSAAINYDGAQLKSFWIRQQVQLHGDAVVAFVGTADVSAHMVDMEDRETQAFIYSPRMLHFIVEHFHMPLTEAIVRQRLLVCSMMEEIQMHSKSVLTRDGDDLFYGGRKLSVSIATLSLMSALIHIGLNIETKGTPVPTAGLAELNVDAKTLAERVMKRYADECRSIAEARCKVLPVV